MFPNFTSLAQIEQKRQELLERAQRRVRQAKVKRGMFEAASWASDITNGITTVSKKSTESTQTDSSESAESLKKTLIDGYSQTNPDSSTPNVRAVMIDVGVDSGVQMVNSSINTDRVNRTDRNIQARPQTSDVGIDNTQQTADVGIDNTPRMLDAETNMKNLDTEDQVEARSWVKNLFNANPNRVALRIKPIKRKTGKDDNRYFLGEKGSLIAAKTGRMSKTYQSIDWVATEEKIRDIWYDGESKSIDESSYMRLEDPLYHASLTRNRKLADPSEGDYADRTKQRLEDSFEFDTSTSTSLDQVDSKNRLVWSIFKNKALLESTGLKKKIIPILKSMGTTSQMDKTGYMWIDGSSISVFGIDSGRVKPAITKKVDWRSTFQEFINLVQDREDVDLFTNEDTTKLAKAVSESVRQLQRRHLAAAVLRVRVVDDSACVILCRPLPFCTGRSLACWEKQPPALIGDLSTVIFLSIDCSTHAGLGLLLLGGVCVQLNVLLDVDIAVVLAATLDASSSASSSSSNSSSLPAETTLSLSDTSTASADQFISSSIVARQRHSARVSNWPVCQRRNAHGLVSRVQ